MDVAFPFKIWKKTESQKQKKHIEKMGEVNGMYTMLGLLNVFLRQKEGERGDVSYNWSWCSDGVGI